jgi:NSS family neurotransmitter:Na+ symporter
MDIQFTPRPQWASPLSYLLVTVGAVVGIGNVLIFPLSVFHYGGLFILFCFLCEIVLAMPLLYAELLLGQRGKQNVVGSIALLAHESKASPWWKKLGWLYFLIAFLTFSYYLVYAAFPIGFLAGSVQALDAPVTSASLAIASKKEMLTNFFILFPCALGLLLAAMWVVGRGIHRGLEIISYLTVPLYLAILLGLASYVIFTGYFATTFEHLAWINNGSSVFMVFLAALTFSFLKLKVGIGSMVVYASHLPFSVSLKRSTCWIVLIDVLVSLLACAIVLPLMQSSSPGAYLGELSTNNMVVIFKQIPHSALIASLFFFAAVLSAWTPLIAMLEAMVTTISEEWNMSRLSALWLVGSSLFVLILCIVLCLTDTIAPMDSLFFGYTYPQLLKDISLEKLTPVAALLISIFIGWVVDPRITKQELRFKPWLYAVWSFLLRYVIPALILFVFILQFPI